MLLDVARSHLIIIDVQQRLLPAILDGEQLLSRISILQHGAQRLGIPVTVTEQYPSGLGSTVAAVLEGLPHDAAVLSKLSFSAARDNRIANRFEEMNSLGRDQLVICGMEAHVCVLQTAVGFRDAGFEVAVVGDAVSSRAAASVDAARERLLQSGCQWVTTEMVIFEWLGQAGTDDFRALSALIR